MPRNHILEPDHFIRWGWSQIRFHMVCKNESWPSQSLRKNSDTQPSKVIWLNTFDTLSLGLSVYPHTCAPSLHDENRVASLKFSVAEHIQLHAGWSQHGHDICSSRITKSILAHGRNQHSSIFIAVTWAATWQNQHSECAPSEDSDQPGYPPSLIRVFAVRMKKPWVLSYPLSAQRRLWSDWADESSLGAHSFC